MIILVFTVFMSSGAVDFTPYRPSEQYKCGAFLQGRVEDKTLEYYYQGINTFVSWISNPFPHQELLNKRALTGDINELKESLETNYWQWISWQRGWLILTGVLLILSIVFPIFYILYRCCICCCSNSSKKQTTDSRYDGCKRNILNIIVTVLVLIDVFAAAALLITGQYAEYGMEELPNRLNHCVDDLNLYKRDTDMRIRKLLIEDYQILNQTISHQLAQSGHSVVDRVKKLTGAHAIDIFLNISQSAKDVQSTVHEAQRQIKVLNENGNRFEIEFARLRKTATEELLQCVANEIDPLKAMCHKAEKLLESMQGTQMRFIVSELISPSIDEALQQIISTNISELLSASNSHFIITENVLQTEIDKKVYSAKNMLKQIGDDLFVVAETISTQIRQINFDELYNKISKVSDTKQSPVMKYVHYSWYASLALTSVFVLIAFCFLIGLFYGVCGRRPTFYNDDCCVRSTGGRFYSCGIWLTVLMFTVLAIITAVLLFVFGNSSNLICQPLRDPLSRPDLMSLLERYMEMWRGNERKLNDLNMLFDQRTPADVIRACQRNETFYEIFELDKKYHLNQLKEFEKESYIQLEKFLRHALDDLPTINPVNAIISKQDLDRLESLGSINISQLSQEGIDRVKSTITELDLLYKSKLFEKNSDNSSGRPKAVTSVLEQIEEIDTHFAKPLRLQLEILHANLTKLNSRLKDMQIPVSSLLGKLQHAQALLSDDIKQHFKHASKDELDSIADSVNQYIYHVKFQMQHEVSSCTPIAELSTSFTSALCSHTIDPLNGAWMSMLVCLLCLVPIVIFSTTLVNLYENMHSFPKYIVEPPQEHHQMSSFITDTYDTRQKPAYSGYSYTDDYHRNYR